MSLFLLSGLALPCLRQSVYALHAVHVTLSWPRRCRDRLARREHCFTQDGGRLSEQKEEAKSTADRVSLVIDKLLDDFFRMRAGLFGGAGLTSRVQLSSYTLYESCM